MQLRLDGLSIVGSCFLLILNLILFLVAWWDLRPQTKESWNKVYAWIIRVDLLILALCFVTFFTLKWVPKFLNQL